MRIAWLFAGMAFLILLSGLRLAYLQLWQSDRLANLALGQRFRGEVIEPERGRIYDRNLHSLAMSIYSDAVYARPERVVDREGTARQLAGLIGADAAVLERRLQINAPSVTLAIRLEPDQAERVREARLPGVYLEPRPQRYYPQGRLAGTVLGFAGADNQGLEGLEFQYDQLLRGIPGRRLRERDAQGRSIPEGREEVIPPVPGHSLVLTIDQTLQYLVEQRLREAVEETKAAWGAVVAVQPRTGEILAMAQEPGFDPHTFGQRDRPFRNRVVSDQIEPGSTFKALVAAIAFELGVVGPQDLLEGPAELLIGGGRVRCWRYPQGFGLQTMEQALANSCNTVFAQLGGRMIPPGDFYAYLRAFGIGEPLGIDFPGEARGHVPVPGRVHGEVLRWANVAFGQGVSLTPLQLAMAFSALVNDGKLMRPYLVKEVRDAAGRTVMRREPEVIRQVVSARTAQQTVRALEKVVVEGTGSLASIDGYRVLGKTGTAQIPIPGGYGDGRVASFIGAAPADDPQVVTLVVLYDVQTAVRYGGQLAAPLFSSITELILEHRGVPRSHLLRAAGASRPTTAGSGASSPGAVRPRTDPIPVPAPSPGTAGGGSAAPAPAEAGDRGAPAPTSPAAATGWQAGGGDWWFHGAPSPYGLEAPATVTVPDVRGMTIRAAIDRMEAAGLRIRVSGSGLAAEQNPAPGAEVPAQTPVDVTFQPPPAIRH